MLCTLWGCIRYYGYVGVPIITHNFNSTSTVDHVLLLHLKTVRRLRREAARAGERDGGERNVGQGEKRGGGVMTRCAGTRLLLAVTSLYYTFLFALGFWVAGSLNPAIDPISPKWTEL